MCDTPTTCHGRAICIWHCCGMSTPRKRRPHKTRGVTAKVYVEVDPAIKVAFEDLVASTGTSKWAVFEALIEHAKTELDDGGRPVWWQADDNASAIQEELPLARSA